MIYSNYKHHYFWKVIEKFLEKIISNVSHTVEIPSNINNLFFSKK